MCANPVDRNNKCQNYEQAINHDQCRSNSLSPDDFSEVFLSNCRDFYPEELTLALY